MKIFLLSFLLFLALSAPGAQAQEATSGKVSYALNTLENVSNVLFRKGVLKLDDPAAIEEYIRIHECGLYGLYGRDDFAWARIRDAYARDLSLSLNVLPDGLEVVSALPLGPYDIAGGEFAIAPVGQMDNVGVVDVLNSTSGALITCEKRGEDSFVPRVHPLKLTVKLDRPITFKSFPLERKLADALITEMNKRKVWLESQRREVTLVMRVRLTTADPLASVGDPLRRSVLGLIDDFRVYEGPDRKQLLYRVDYQAQREKEAKR